MLGLVYHLEAAWLFSKCCYLLLIIFICFVMDIWSQLPLCWLGPWPDPCAEQCSGSDLLVTVTDYWVSRRRGLLDAVPLATVRTGIKTGPAGPSLADALG